MLITFNMNSKIRDIVGKSNANSYTIDAGCGVVTKIALFDDDIEEFAKLIIRECCDIVRYVDAVEIKKHFGIE